MSQTTGATTLRNVKAEISADNVTWVNISGQFNALDISGGEIETGEVYTADGLLPIVGTGKAKMTEVKLKVVYTESGSEAWSKFFDAYNNQSAMYFRYSPRGGNAGNLLFTSGTGYVTSPVYPQGEVSDGKPVLCELKFTCPGFTKSTI